MAVRKVADIVIKAGPNGRTDATGKGIKFYSLDKNSAAIDFYFRNQDGSETDLINANIALLLLIKDGDNQEEFPVIDSDLSIMSRIKGHARYIIPDRLRGYVGQVEGYVSLSFPDESRTDDCRFTFSIERSKFEEQYEKAGDYYITEIQAVFDDVKSKLDGMIPKMETEFDKLVASLTEYANEKIIEYDKQFVTLNQTILAVQTSISAVETDIDALKTQTQNIQQTQAAILKSIEENKLASKEDLENLKQESSANVIDNIAGTEKAILKNGLLIDGISGTGARDDNGTLIPFVQDDYYKLASTDTYVRNETLVSGRGAEIQFDFNVIETLESRYPAIFESSTTIAEKISKYKTIIKNVNANIIIRGRGIHSSTNVATNFSRLFLSWGTNYSNNTSLGIASSSDFSKINSNLSVLGINSISNKGYYTLFAVTRRTGASDNGAVSDGVTPAWVEVKDISLTVELEVNGRTIIESMIAANHVENIATKEEAETATNNSKTMTPLRTKQQIDKRMATKEEVIAGIATDKLVSPATLHQYMSMEVGEWVALALNSGVIAADSTVPQYRITSHRTGDVVKKLVEFRGAVTLTAGTIPSSENTTSAATIASELRPTQTAMASCSTNVLSVVGRVHVTKAGNMGIGQNSGQTINYLYLNNLRYWLD